MFKRPDGWWLAIPVLAAVAALAVYYPAFGFDLWQDDIIGIRPWTAAELAGTWAGRYDPLLLNPPFWRPLTAAYFALLFDVFGVNGAGLHVMNVVLLVAIASLVGRIVWAETGSAWAACLAVVIYVVHPVTVRTTGGWIFLQFHGLAACVVLLMLAVWQRCRTRSWRAWWPLGVLTVAGFLIKEDTLMMAPALLALQALRAWRWRDVRAPGPALIASGAAIAGVLLAARFFLLREAGYVQELDVVQFGRAILRGPMHVLAVSAESVWRWPARAAAVALLVCGAAAAWRRPPSRWAWLMTSGIALIGFATLPLMALQATTRYYALVAFAPLVFAGAIGAAADRARSRPARIALVGVVAILVSTLSVSARAETMRFEPCRQGALSFLRWYDHLELPFELRAWSDAQHAACAAGRYEPLRTLPLLGWRVEHDAAGGAIRWARDQAVLMIRPDATQATFSLRHALAGPASPVLVTIRAAGARPTVIELTSTDWQEVEVPLPVTWRTPLRGMHRVDFSVRDTSGATSVALRVRLSTTRP